MGWVDWQTLSIALVKNWFSRLRTEESTVVYVFQKAVEIASTLLRYFDQAVLVIVGHTTKSDS